MRCLVSFCPDLGGVCAWPLCRLGLPWPWSSTILQRRGWQAQAGWCGVQAPYLIEMTVAAYILFFAPVVQAGLAAAAEAPLRSPSYLPVQSPGRRCVVVPVRWCAGALVRRCAGALVRRCAGALVQWRAGFVLSHCPHCLLAIVCLGISHLGGCSGELDVLIWELGGEPRVLCFECAFFGPAQGEVSCV